MKRRKCATRCSISFGDICEKATPNVRRQSLPPPFTVVNDFLDSQNWIPVPGIGAAGVFVLRLPVPGQANVARHHGRSRFEILVDGSQSEAIATDLLDRHPGHAVSVNFTAPAYRKVY